MRDGHAAQKIYKAPSSAVEVQGAERPAVPVQTPRTPPKASLEETGRFLQKCHLPPPRGRGGRIVQGSGLVPALFKKKGALVINCHLPPKARKPPPLDLANFPAPRIG